MIRIFLETTSSSPIEKVYGAYLGYVTGQNPGGRDEAFETELLSAVPFSEAKGVVKENSRATNFAFKFFAAGSQVKIESVWEVRMLSAWWWFGQPLIAKTFKDHLRQRVEMISKDLDGDRAEGMRIRAYIGRWPLWAVAVVLWLALVFVSMAFFQILGLRS